MSEQPDLTISLVVYAPALDVLAKTLASLEQAIIHAKSRGCLGATALVLVDNGPETRGPTAWREWLAIIGNCDAVSAVTGQGNVGYGQGHNLAIGQGLGRYHLVLNPDVVLAEDALTIALSFMNEQPDVGLLAPAVIDAEGRAHSLCKRFPSVLDLWLRGFAPPFLRRAFRRRLDRYEMRDRVVDTVVWDVPLISGCFMLFRGRLLEEIGGFSPAYFLYFEDFDISLRAAQKGRNVCVPAVRITHFGGHAARKGWRHIGLFTRSAVTFFNRQGWKWA